MSPPQASKELLNKLRDDLCKPPWHQALPSSICFQQTAWSHSSTPTLPPTHAAAHRLTPPPAHTHTHTYSYSLVGMITQGLSTPCWVQEVSQVLWELHCFTHVNFLETTWTSRRPKLWVLLLCKLQESFFWGPKQQLWSCFIRKCVALMSAAPPMEKVLRPNRAVYPLASQKPRRAVDSLAAGICEALLHAKCCFCPKYSRWIKALTSTVSQQNSAHKGTLGSWWQGSRYREYNLKDYLRSTFIFFCFILVCMSRLDGEKHALFQIPAWKITSSWDLPWYNTLLMHKSSFTFFCREKKGHFSRNHTVLKTC